MQPLDIKVPPTDPEDFDTVHKHIYANFAGLVAPTGLGGTKGAQVMRGYGPRYYESCAGERERTRAFALRLVQADVRINLWENGRLQLTRQGLDLVPDAQPLRCWWPGKFVEPFRRRAVATGWETTVSWWWKHAPFEVRLLNDHETHGIYAFAYHTHEHTAWDLWCEPKWWVWAITRRYYSFSPAKFILLFRPLCNHP